MSEKVKKYQLFVTIFGSRHESGSAIATHVFGPYDYLNQCEEAGQEMKAGFGPSSYISLYYTCVPIYVVDTETF